MTNSSSLSKAKFSATAAMVSAVLSWLTGFIDGPGMHILSLSLLFVTLAALAGIVYFQRRVEGELRRTQDVCAAVAKGDFESRLIDICEGGDFGDFQWSVNEMIDYMDAFVREATAAMVYVGNNQYFRRIMEGGMQGSLLNGTRVINRATESVEAKMQSFTDVANDVDYSLKDVVSDITTNASSLSQTAQVMGEAVGQTRSGAYAAVSSSDDTSVNVQAISAAAEEMSSSIAEISQQVSRTSDMAKNAVDEARESGKTVQELSENAQKIGEIVQLIEQIAEQTNLLALNATIEAARAGDAGKGFAVVAAEVKDLAQQTAGATEEIGQQIASIQNATQSAVRSFDGIGKIITDISEAASAVAAAVEEQNAASREIASSAGKASEGTSQAAQNIRNINDEIGHVDEAAQRVAEVTSVLSDQTVKKVQDLLEKMDHFMGELKKIA